MAESRGVMGMLGQSALVGSHRLMRVCVGLGRLTGWLVQVMDQWIQYIYIYIYILAAFVPYIPTIPGSVNAVSRGPWT
jgi:hypothetical protein